MSLVQKLVYVMEKATMTDSIERLTDIVEEWRAVCFFFKVHCNSIRYPVTLFYRSGLK